MLFAMHQHLIVLLAAFSFNNCHENNLSSNFFKRDVLLETPPDVNQCGKLFSCIRYMTSSTDNCTVDNCMYLLSYKPPTSQTVDFFLSAIDSQFVAVGFTLDKSKRNSEILACVKENGVVSFKMYSWIGPGEKLQPILYNNTQAQLLDSDSRNGIRCLIERTSVPWNPQLKDLTLDLFQIHLWGNVQDGVPNILNGMEPKDDWRSLDRKEFLSTILNNKNINDYNPTPESYKMCGLQLSCIRIVQENQNPNCTYEDCTYHLMYTPLIERKMTLVLGAEDADYVAVGLTKTTTSLEDTEIIGCQKTKNGKIEAFRYWVTNFHQMNAPQVKNTLVKFQNGTAIGNGLWCNVIKTVPVNKKDESSTFYQLYMWGRNDADGRPILMSTPSHVIQAQSQINLAGSAVNTYKWIPKSGGVLNSSFNAIVLILAIISISI